MKLNTKEILWLFAMGLFYIGLGFLGHIFPPVYLFSFVLGVPYVIYVYKKGTEWSSLLMALIVVLVLVFSHMGSSALIITFLLFIPSAICGLFFNKQIILSKNIINLTVIYFVVFFGMILLFNYAFNINIMDDYHSIVATLEKIWDKSLNSKYEMYRQNPEFAQSYIKKLFPKNYDGISLSKLYALEKLALKYNIYFMTYFFPFFVFLFGFFCAFIQVLVTMLILQGLNWKAPNIKHISDIAIKPLTIGLFGLIAILRVNIANYINPLLIVSMDNILLIFFMFIFLIGFMFVIHILQRINSGYNFKIISIILLLVVMKEMPDLFIVLFITLGLLEAIFNFRNKERFL
ncbi:MAG TPA: DUF2232 domain-containing protein [Defluviitaleaceae bacterium]|nr:DUF2232 domain-containing protein [Defluviitaleaceae bacterium]HQD50674.1 DUF2232 domain-containing protein [Defluviitaleaceae bacterium]